jgi:hypothetical protein
MRGSASQSVQALSAPEIARSVELPVKQNLTRPCRQRSFNLGMELSGSNPSSGIVPQPHHLQSVGPPPSPLGEGKGVLFAVSRRK